MFVKCFLRGSRIAGAELAKLLVAQGLISFSTFSDLALLERLWILNTYYYDLFLFVKG